MTKLEMDIKVLGLIEELNPNSEFLTDDPDIATKKDEVMNQVMFELARLKKIPRYVEIKVNEGDLINFDKLERACGSEVYQIAKVSGVKYNDKADGTVIKVLESGTAEIDLYIYPERITEKTKAKAYEFELSPDALEIMPFGVAGDLLKSDVSTNYGRIYTEEYERKLQRLDPRYSMPTISFEDGWDI